MAKRIIYYKCPFSCDKKFDREKLIKHVDDKHQDELPEGFSTLRYVFHYVNNKPLEYHGRCTECKGDTPWDEKVGRYKRQCGSKACHDSFVRKFEENMVKKTGHKRVTETQKGLEEMLKKRKISGKYKFQNGKEKEYVGSYEKNCLEFMDKVMNIDPDDIMSPGPTMEYVLDGKRHYYITDFYYQPYNLIIEVKDGGDNPNKRNMPEYRKKQMAKEKFIIDNTDYNYIRLTNNDMSQLLAVMADLKMQLVDGSGDRVIHVNEAMKEFIKEASANKSTLDKNHKVKTDKSFKFINFEDSSIKKYLNRDIDLKNNIEYWLNKEKVGEIAVCTDDDKYAGYVMVGTQNKSKGVLGSLFVSPEYRGYGVSDILVEDAIKKYDAWQVGVYADNEIAIKLYTRHGFVKVDQFIHAKETVYIMVLRSKMMYYKKNNLNENGLRTDPYVVTVRRSITEAAVKNFTRYDLNDPKASEYFKNLKMNKDDYVGEVLVDSKSKEEIGHVLIGNKKDKGFITDLGVESNYRKQGFGTMLLKDAINNYGGIDLSVEKSNTVALNMYKNNGFVIIKEYEEKGKTMYWMKLKSKLSKDDKVINEGIILNSKDILYNKDKFDNGEINICFITGLSGSGKSTLANNLEKNGVEKYELDDVLANYAFSDKNLKEYGDLIYSFFMGKGKQYRMTKAPSEENNWLNNTYTDKFEKGLIRDFVFYSINYANTHSNKKFVIEGVELYWFFEPEELKDYAVYIKGTSALLSRIRATIRDSKDAERLKRLPIILKNMLRSDRAHAYLASEKVIQKWRKYFDKESVKESVIFTEASTSKMDLEKIIMNADKLKKEEKSFVNKGGFTNYIIKIKSYNKWLRGRSELLLFKDNSILLALDLDGKGYTVPGGGWEPNESHGQAARRECNEEVGYETTIPKYMCTYAALFPPQDWVKNRIVEKYWWYGEYTELFCAEYDGIYNQVVKPADQYPFMKKNAKWYSIDVVWNMLIPPHKAAIIKYFGKQNNPFGQTFIP